MERKMDSMTMKGGVSPWSITEPQLRCGLCGIDRPARCVLVLRDAEGGVLGLWCSSCVAGLPARLAGLEERVKALEASRPLL